MSRETLLLAALAAGIVWLMTRRSPRELPAAGAVGELPADAGDAPVFTAADGREYRAAGDPTDDGLVPVAPVTEPGMFAPTVVMFYDPSTGTVSAGQPFMTA